MEVLDTDVFKFGEFVNEKKKLSKVMEMLQLLEDKSLEHDIEKAMAAVCEKHKIDLDKLEGKTTESRYPNLCKIYMKLDDGFNNYPEDEKYEKVDELFRTLKEEEIGETFDEFKNNGGENKYRRVDRSPPKNADEEDDEVEDDDGDDGDDDTAEQEMQDRYWESLWFKVHDCLTPLAVTPWVITNGMESRYHEMVSDGVSDLMDEVRDAYLKDSKLNSQND
jgi:hypothetical protein